MAASPSQWKYTFTKTQQYLRNRITGNDCERDQIEAWRHFYRTHDPIVRFMLMSSGMDPDAGQCGEEVWLDVIADLGCLRPPQTQDSFLYWLRKLVRRTAQQYQRIEATRVEPSLRRDSANKDLPLATDDQVGLLHDGEFTNLNERLLYLRFIEAQPIDRVARTLGLTSQQVGERERGVLRQILSVLIRLDVAPVST